jgi:hypothetical protein
MEGSLVRVELQHSEQEAPRILAKLVNGLEISRSGQRLQLLLTRTPLWFSKRAQSTNSYPFTFSESVNPRPLLRIRPASDQTTVDIGVNFLLDHSLRISSRQFEKLVSFT